MTGSSPMTSFATFASRSKSKLTLASSLESLEKEESSAKKAEQSVAFPTNSGELPYHENVHSKAYKAVFCRLTVPELKLARLVCRKWHQEIYPLLEEQSCFQFQGVDDSSDLRRARDLSTFLNVVPKDSFQWKMLKALYPKPEDALPIPVLIQWSTLRVRDCNYCELRQWVSRIHVPNVSFLQLFNVRLNWSKYLLIFREFEGLSKIQDTSLSLESGIWEEFERGCAYNEKLALTPIHQAQYSTAHHPDLLWHSGRIREIQIRRARLEEVILFLKLFLGMNCSRLEVLQVSAENTMGGSGKNMRKKNNRLQEPKTILFAHLGALLARNGESLKNLKLSFRHSSISGWFEQYTKPQYEDGDGTLYKPDLLDWILFIKQCRWHEMSLKKLEVLELEFENKKIPTVEEIEYLTTFLSSLSGLKSLSLSHVLLTSYNSLSLPLLLSRLGSLMATNGTEIRVGVSLRNNDTEGLSQSSKDRDQLPSNLEMFYSSIQSLIVTCHSHEMDVRSSLFPWVRQNTSPTPMSSTTSTLLLGGGTSTSTTSLPAGGTTGVQDLWVIDERPGVKNNNLQSLHHAPLFHAGELVSSYPNLGSLIIRDSGSGLKASGSDLCRWTILDDFGLQCILRNLGKLKHFDVRGNLFFLTDYGVTGLAPGEGGRKEKEIESETRSESSEPGSRRISFAALKSLEHCSLEYLGPKFTPVSIKYGFNDMKALKYLRIAGLIQADPVAIKRLKDAYSGTNCQIEVVSYKQ